MLLLKGLSSPTPLLSDNTRGTSRPTAQETAAETSPMLSRLTRTTTPLLR